jgi:hypothetical protein
MTQKKKTFSKVKAVKDAARVKVGTPKATHAIPDTKAKQEGRGAKYRKTPQEWMEEG